MRVSSTRDREGKGLKIWRTYYDAILARMGEMA